MKSILILAIFACMVASQHPEACPKDGRLVKCSTLPKPVCGITKKGNKQIRQCFPNHCLACALGKVDFTVEGKCKDFPKNVHFCSPADKLVVGCPKNLDPQCGWFDSHVACLVYPCAINGGNKCDACKVEHVLYTTPGFCPTSL